MRIKKPEFSIGLFVFLAEREGFEPSEEVSPLTRLAGERLQPTRPSLRLQLNGGGSRIRTHGAVTLNGFQDRRFRPLSHPSVQVEFLIIILRIIGQYFCYCWLTWPVFYDFRQNIRHQILDEFNFLQMDQRLMFS